MVSEAVKKAERKEKLKTAGFKLLIFAIFIGIWEGAIKIFHIKKFILPEPQNVLKIIFKPKGAVKTNGGWWINIGTTAEEIFVSFLVVAIVGFAIAVLIAWSKSLNKLLMPVIVLFSSIPKIALAPLFLLWFGYGLKTNIIVAVAVAIFPVIIDTVTGLIEVDPALLDLVGYLGATKWQVFAKIRIPNALPHMFAGLKTSAVMSVAGAIVGEFVASKYGLGRLLRSAQANIDMATMFACLVLLAILGMLFFKLIDLAEKLCMPWKDRTVKED